MKAEINNETEVYPPSKEQILPETLQACAASRKAREWAGTDPHTNCGKCDHWAQIYGCIGYCQNMSVISICGDYPRMYRHSPGCQYWEQSI